jgi:predicted nucleotidyltransferase
MLEIFNNLAPFFNDVTKEVSVREYAKIVKISPPTASTILKLLEKEGLLIKRQVGIYHFYKANINYQFKQLAKAYWQKLLFDNTEELYSEIDCNDIILFGSIAKTENNANSDIDIYVNTSEKDIKSLAALEKKLQRKAELHFKNRSPHLNKNIRGGIRIR